VDQPWHGGFSPPGRFLAASIPLLAVCAAMMLDRLRGRFAWSVTAALYAVTLGQTLLVSIRPEWRFHRGVGRATPLVEFFTYTGLDPGRLVPSYVTLGNAWVGPGAAVLAAIALAGWLVGKRSGAAPPRGTWIMGLVAAALLTLILDVTQVSVTPSARLAYIENIEVTALTRHAAGAAAGASR